MRIKRTVRRSAIAVMTGGLIAGLLVTSGSAGADGRGDALAERLRTAVGDQNFKDVVDKMPPGGRTAADPPAHQMPSLDTAVIELDSQGRPVAAANVLYSPTYPDGRIVPLDENMATTAVRWRAWNTEEWNAGSAGSVDLVPGRENAPLEHMATYPASVLKLMVGFGVLRLVDRGTITLQDQVTLEPDSPCTYDGPTVRTVDEWFDSMITVSDNRATCALLKMLYDKNAVDDVNKTFQDIGLPTLKMVAARPDGGSGWIDTMKMTAMETAKLLLVVNGSPGALWHRPDGKPVTRGLLSAESRKYFYRLLSEQGLNQVLTTTNWCGREYPAEGLIQKAHERWIDTQDGTMTVAGRVYGQDVRPCNERSEVTFAHKTGLSDHGGSDAGIVHSVRGAPGRHYIVVVFSNLGYRYTDPDKPADPPGIYPVSYTEKLGLLGKAIDGIMAERRSAYSAVASE